jgi:hypothetical protein
MGQASSPHDGAKRAGSVNSGRHSDKDKQLEMYDLAFRLAAKVTGVPVLSVMEWG